MASEAEHTDAEDTLWAIRIVGEFIQEEIDNRNIGNVVEQNDVSDDHLQAYLSAPREAYAAFNLLRAAALRNEIRDAQRQPPDPLATTPTTAEGV